MWNVLEIFSMRMTAMLQSSLNVYDEGKLTLTRNSMKEVLTKVYACANGYITV